MRPAAVLGLVVATAAAAYVLGARIERWRTHRALDAAVQIIDQFAQDNLDRAARQDAEEPLRGLWITTPSAWATWQNGYSNRRRN